MALWDVQNWLQLFEIILENEKEYIHPAGVGQVTGIQNGAGRASDYPSII